MPLFSKRTAILWPHKSTVDLYLDSKENNLVSFEVDLWQSLAPVDLAPLATYLKDNHLASISVLVPDDVIVTKSFVYDTKITDIDAQEVIKLAAGTVNFDITSDSVSYNLIPQGEQTIIRAEFADQKKLSHLKQNLSGLGIQLNSFTPVSAAISLVITTFYQQEYFLIYTLNPNDSFLILSSGQTVYLTNYLKKSALNIQKLINYSKLYFNHTVEKIFLPSVNPPDISAVSQLDKTFYDSVQIANSLHLPSSLPLPVLGLLLTPKTSNINQPMTDTLISPTPTADTAPKSSKNILPVIAVFVVTAAVASIAIWFVLNRDQSTSLTTPSGQAEPTIAISDIPTEAPPTPTLATVDKTLKLQVLNATDINGQAATLKASLLELGFTNITVGNSKDKVTGNEVRLKSSLATVQSYFEGQLSTSFPASYTANLKDSSTYDVVFIIGSDLKNPQAATATEATSSPIPTTE